MEDVSMWAVCIIAKKKVHSNRVIPIVLLPLTPPFHVRRVSRSFECVLPTFLDFQGQFWVSA